MGKVKSSNIDIFAKETSKLSFIGTLHKDEYKLVKNRIIGHSEGGTKDIVTDLLIQAGWDENRDKRNIFAPVIECFMQIPDINVEILRYHCENKLKQKFFDEHLKLKAPFNLYKMFNYNLNSLFPEPEFKRLIDELWSITTCVNQVGIGPGEICLSILTDAKKGSKGDLLITNVGDVEIKSSFGRLGSGDNALQYVARAKKLVGKYIGINSFNSSWNTIVQKTFYNNYLNKKQLLELCTYLSTQTLSENQTNLLKIGLNKIFDQNNLVKLLKTQDRKLLADLALSIQLSCYQDEHKFTHLLSINKDTKWAYSFSFPYNKLDKNIISIYNQITEIGRFRTNLAIDSKGMRKGIEINFV